VDNKLTSDAKRMLHLNKLSPIRQNSTQFYTIVRNTKSEFSINKKSCSVIIICNQNLVVTVNMREKF